MSDFTVKLPCKKYVKAYLETNCGKPVNLRYWPDLLQIFKDFLDKSSESELVSTLVYTETVSIIIPNDSFYRYGFNLSREHICLFNKKIEEKLKFTMRQYVTFNHSLGITVSDCIREFQDTFGMNENIWPYESIKKEYDRHGKKTKLKSIVDLKTELHRNLLADMYKIGLISEDYLNSNVARLTDRELWTA